MENGKKTKAVYEAPTITSMDASEVLALIGPAQGLSSGVDGPGIGNLSGVSGAVSPGSPRHFGRR